MDKNKIKSFAVWARRKLISSVQDRARYIGIFIDNEGKYNELKAEQVQGGFKLEGVEGVFKLSYKDRKVLTNRIRSYEDNKKGFEQVMEEVAYTWFNRFMGLRYMEVNDYLPTSIRILSSEIEGKTEPDVLTRVSEVIDELELNADYIYELLDSGKTEDREEAYKHILVKQCNELGKIIPQMFEKISDYTELLLPDNLLEEGSVIRRMVDDIEESDWREEVEIIGWMYQYYISEKKDEVFAALKKNVKITKENIPAATQLFTPKWIVKYMVENSLGRLWLEGHPNEELQKQWRYYLEEAEQDPEVEEELKKIREENSKLKPEDIKVLDPCMGSGHILVYAFDVLYEIYKSAGYSEREIPRLILQNNLYGLDIDDRAAQLASFALIMKARHYNRRLFREIEKENIDLNLCSIQESNDITKEVMDYFVQGNEELRKDTEYLVAVFTDAKEYGSILEVEQVNFQALKQRLKEIEEDQNFMFGDYRRIILDKLPIIIKQAEIMSRKYEICVTNPPYMGNRGIGKKLNKYLKDNYSKSKSDLSTVFMEKCISKCKNKGYMSMINIPTWMFIKTYNKFRENLLDENGIVNLTHLGRGVFGSDFGSTAFIIRKGFKDNYKGLYKKLFDNQVDVDSLENKEKLFLEGYQTFITKQQIFDVIPTRPIAYWISNRVVDIYNNSASVGTYSEVTNGLFTCNNDYFLKMWYEVNLNKCIFNCENMNETEEINKKWLPYNKGGAFRKWYGNHENIINYKDSGREVREFRVKQGQSSSFPGEKYYLNESLSWSFVSYSTFGVRFYPKGFVFDIAGSSVFADRETLLYLAGYLCSKVAYEFLKINPTINYQAGNIDSLPIIFVEDKKERIKILVNNSIEISKLEWNSFETSWNFKIHPLLKFLDKVKDFKLSSSFEVWKNECDVNFNKLKANEEELNRIFIDIYGLQNELTPEVEDKDITIRKADRERDIKSFISYTIGCMLGRYSIDVEGLVYAGGDFEDKWSFGDKKVRKIVKDDNGNVVEDSWVDATFLPDEDNIIPITEDEYFEDDIVTRFIEFVRTVYGEVTLEENLDFIADSIGRKSSETSRQAIRRYFVKDFYKDHLKVYQKRPIYWMFDSGKNDGFKALIYMHRYDGQTVARVRTDYLHKLQRKYEAEIQRQQLIVDSDKSTVKDKTTAKKNIDRIAKQIEECREYDQVVAHIANERKPIDLDDGVKVNYSKFQEVKVINSKGKEVKMDLLAKI